MPYDIRLKNVTKEFTSGKNKGVLAVDNISLDIEQGEFFALLGPSGCGKTTTLRMIAGFEQPTNGAILIRDEPMEHVPPFHRPVNTVFQDYALFPHMTVLQNIMFGLKMEGVDENTAKQRAYEALELVRLPDVASRRPTQLSGGQQQRVALARALVKRPAVLLLDEPLGALDLKLRKQMQNELKSMQQEVGITFIYVTHDQEEAMTMADRIAVMSQGHVLQVDVPREIYEHPATRFVADFIGETNFIPGILLGRNNGVGHVRLASNTEVDVRMPEEFAVQAGPVTIPIRPERIGLAPLDAPNEIPKDVPLTVLDGTVVESQYIGTDTRYTVKIPGDNLIVARMQNRDYEDPYTFDAGDTVKVFWALQSTHLLDQ
jgi:spermidine/putrescine transport system ATP-binding protein